tara:strand:+ start:548 stop:766 length:219 start_codon:yes stop_codon:yes gene_type:complete
LGIILLKTHEKFNQQFSIKVDILVEIKQRPIKINIPLYKLVDSKNRFMIKNPKVIDKIVVCDFINCLTFLIK